MGVRRLGKEKRIASDAALLLGSPLRGIIHILQEGGDTLIEMNTNPPLNPVALMTVPILKLEEQQNPLTIAHLQESSRHHSHLSLMLPKIQKPIRLPRELQSLSNAEFALSQLHYAASLTAAGMSSVSIASSGGAKLRIPVSELKYEILFTLVLTFIF